MYDTYACGMLEFSSIAAGIESSDQMLKAAEVEPMMLKTICPGKFLTGIKGNIGAVTASVEAGLRCGGVRVVDWFTLANVHGDVFPALSGTGITSALLAQDGTKTVLHSLGIIETYSASAAILASDAAAKAASVLLLDIRMAMGLGGKGYLLLTGDVAAVQAAVDAGSARAAAEGLLVSKVVIPRPTPKVWEQIL